MRILFSLCLCFFTSSLFASQVDSADTEKQGERNSISSFYRNKNEGWFFYNELLEKERMKELEQELTEKLAEAEEQEQEREAARPAPSPSQPQKTILTVKFLRENLERATERAIEQPTNENVLSYMILMRSALDMATRFALRGGEVSAANLAIDESRNNPIDLETVNRRKLEAIGNREAFFSTLAERLGLWVFFKNDCFTCQSQIGAVKMFASSYGISVIGISLDGKDFQKEPFGATLQHDPDMEQLKRFGFTDAPAIAMVWVDNTNQEITPIALAQGTISFDKLKDRIITLARFKGWISDEQYYLTQTSRFEYLADNELDTFDPLPDFEDVTTFNSYLKDHVYNQFVPRF